MMFQKWVIVIKIDLTEFCLQEENFGSEELILLRDIISFLSRLKKLLLQMDGLRLETFVRFFLDLINLSL